MSKKKNLLITGGAGAAVGIAAYIIGKKGKSSNTNKDSDKGAVLILVNHDVVIYNFRLELVERLLADGYEVHISSPYGERIDDLIALGANYHEIAIERHGMNPAKELGILAEYCRLIKEIKPIIVFGYTIKPNIYGVIASRLAGVPFVANITGLGTAVENGGWQQELTIAMYHVAFGRKRGKIQKVFFQNRDNQQFFEAQNIAIDKHAILPGSGVNLNRYTVAPYPACGDGKTGEPIKFAFISRIMKEKGIEEYLSVGEAVKKNYPSTEFHIAGFAEEEYEGRLDELNTNGTVIYHGMIRDVAGLMGQMHCIVHPTYYPEGLSNVLLEASACGRPIITTDRPGCREVCNNGSNGYLVKEKDYKDLSNKIEQFIALPQPQKQAMGKAGRKLVEERFDRQIVVEAYMEELHRAEKG